MADNSTSSKIFGIEPADLHPDGRRLTRREIREREARVRISTFESDDNSLDPESITNAVPLADNKPNQSIVKAEIKVALESERVEGTSLGANQYTDISEPIEEENAQAELDTTESATVVSIEPAWAEDIILQPADEPSGKIPRLPQRAPVAELFARSGGNILADREEINIGKLEQKLNMDPAALVAESVAKDFIFNDAVNENIIDDQNLSAQTAQTLSDGAKKSTKLLMWWHYLLIYSVVFVIGLVLGIIFFGGK